MPPLFTVSWTDDSDNVCALVEDTFEEWITMKSQAPSGLLRPFRQNSPSSERRYFAAGLTETLRNGGSQTTKVTAIRSLDPLANGSASGQITVDVHNSNQDAHAQFRSPWLIRQLIARGVRPRVAEDLLMVSPTIMRGADAGEALAEQVTSFERRLPIVVMSSVPDLFQRLFRPYSNPLIPLRRDHRTLAGIAAGTARSCAGLATVVLVDEPCRVVFNEAVGPYFDLALGGLRVFRPDADPAVVNDAGRHPQRRAESWYTHPTAAPAFVGRLLASDAVSAARAAVAV
ncbi:hypothetical protein ACQP1G_20655 [Nocardia sp. CA-107356]|uniref:hypothetical protein n=1 Tax=Nocardia sp. CA-107356 TaxID=3239972 RepID=UPI003D8DC814